MTGDCLELHDDLNGASELLDAIRKRESIPFFGIGRESWEFEVHGWSKYFYACDVLEGREKYYWSFITEI